MVVVPAGAESVTVKTAVTDPLLPSPTTASPMDREGCASSLRIVPCPCPSARVAFVGLLRLTKNVSSASYLVSPFTVTLTGFEVSPGLNVRVPEVEA